MSLTLGAKCLAYHGPLIYEAKIMRLHEPDQTHFETIDQKSSKPTKVKITKSNFPQAKFLGKLAYYVHYKGWNTKWDEWVGVDRVLAYTDENLEKAKGIMDEIEAAKQKAIKEQEDIQAAKEAAILEAKQKKEEEKKQKEKEKQKEKDMKMKLKAKDTKLKNGHAGSNGASNGNSEPRSNGKTSSSNGHHSNGQILMDDVSNNFGTKRKYDEVADFEDSFVKRPEITITVSDGLKCLLVDDWELITKEKKLVDLPVREGNNVNSILKKFSKYYFKDLEIGTSEHTNGVEMIEGLKLYFNRSLGTILLYQFEREQFKDILEDNKNCELVKNQVRSLELSEIYGAEHFLRLLVALPGLMAQTSMDLKSINCIKVLIEKFFVFLNEFSTELFIKDYVNTSPSYESLSRL